MSYEIYWTPTAQKHLEYWRKCNSAKLVRIKLLCESVSLNPQTGIGKPEKLKFFGNNVWSRRINLEHRLVYKISNDKRIFILQARYHY